MAIQVVIPEVGESVSEVILVEWLKSDGDYVEKDEPVCILETDKADIELPSPAAGALQRSREEGETIQVGDAIGSVDDKAGKDTLRKKSSSEKKEEKKGMEESAGGDAEPKGGEGAQPPSEEGEAPEKRAEPEGMDELSPAVRRLVAEHNLNPKDINGSGKGGRLTKEDVIHHIEGRDAARKGAGPEPTTAPKKKESEPPKQPQPAKPAGEAAQSFDENGVKRIPMTKIRRRIAERLVRAQRTAAMLTTFNEIDMTPVLGLRKKYKERFESVHGVSLGIMSFFTRACVLGLKQFPQLNAYVEGDEVVFHNFIHMAIAVSTDRGLVVPVIRNVEDMSLAEIEYEIKRLGKAAREGKLGINELSGGTFSITNGGVFGSLLSTPILNPPQSGILGMHTIQDRPMAVDGEVKIRSMMYVALTYDHRLIDGREAVQFLVRVKEMIEDPSRLLLGI